LKKIESGEIFYKDMDPWNQEMIARYLPESNTERFDIEHAKFTEYMNYIEKIKAPLRNIKYIGYHGYNEVSLDEFDAMDTKQKISTLRCMYPGGMKHIQFEYTPGERMCVLYEGVQHSCSFLRYHDTEQSQVQIVIDNIGPIDSVISALSSTVIEE